jgi:hypothetical protein
MSYGIIWEIEEMANLPIFRSNASESSYMRVVHASCLRGSLILLMIISGCNGKSVPTIKVQGTVTYKGKPVEQGSVAFHPIEVYGGHPRRIAAGKIGPQGTYSLSTFEKDDGAIPGEYKVIIISREQRKSFEGTEEEVAALKFFIPVAYSKLEQTPLKETISANAAEPVQLDFILEGELPN